jgi:hypothetical protein
MIRPEIHVRWLLKLMEDGLKMVEIDNLMHGTFWTGCSCCCNIQYQVFVFVIFIGTRSEIIIFIQDSPIFDRAIKTKGPFILVAAEGFVSIRPPEAEFRQCTAPPS